MVNGMVMDSVFYDEDDFPKCPFCGKEMKFRSGIGWYCDCEMWKRFQRINDRL
jgi:ribosomal protein L37AE/L43A